MLAFPLETLRVGRVLPGLLQANAAQDCVGDVVWQEIREDEEGRSLLIDLMMMIIRSPTFSLISTFFVNG